MPEYIWQDLIDRARTHVDDDHDGSNTRGFISPERWLDFGGIELGMHYRRWLRSGLVTAHYGELQFTGATYTIGVPVLAVIGVADNSSGTQIPLQGVQSSMGKELPWNGATTPGPARTWQASGNSDAVTVYIEPEVTGDYTVRYLPAYERPTDPSQTVNLIDGADERLVLGMARRSCVKGGTASALLERLILEADVDIGFAAMSRLHGDSPRVRRVRSTAPRVTYPTDPRSWWWI